MAHPRNGNQTLILSPHAEVPKLQGQGESRLHLNGAAFVLYFLPSSLKVSLRLHKREVPAWGSCERARRGETNVGLCPRLPKFRNECVLEGASEPGRENRMGMGMADVITMKGADEGRT